MPATHPFSSAPLSATEAAEKMYAFNSEAWVTGPRDFEKVERLLDASVQLAQKFPEDTRPPAVILEWAVAQSMQSTVLWDRCDYVAALDSSSAAVKQFEQLLAGDLTDPQKKRAREWLSRTYNTVGVSHDLRGEHGHAAVAYQRALEAAREIDMPIHVAQVYSNLGCSYGAIGQYAKALEVNLKANEIHRALPDPTTAVVLSYCALSETCLALNQVAEAKEHARTALQIAESKNYHREAINALIKVAQVAAKEEDWETAESTFRSASARAASTPHPSYQAAAESGLGRVYLACGQPQQAVEAFTRAAQLREKSGELVWEAEARIDLGRAFRQLKQLEAAAKALHEGLQLAIEKDRKHFAADAVGELSAIAEERGDLAESLRYLRLYQQYREAVLNKETIRQTSGLRAIYETERIQREAAAERARKEELEKLLEIAEEAKAKAEEATRIKSEFLSIAAHDLRGPLGAISQLAEMIDDSTDPANRRDYIEEIRRAAAQMLHLVKDVLDASTLETQPLQLEFSSLNLPLLVQYEVKGARRLAQQKAQTIELALQVAPDTIVQADTTRLQQIFGNLLSNAIKFSPLESLITVRLESVHRNGQPFIRFSVSDEGPGFSSSQAERLFQAFSRIGSRPTGGESSIGLGLLIVKRLAELHGGAAFAHSDGPGKGATFAVDLPASAQSA
ncbi:MAG: tetratricopeptide repeat protein [Opitutales bacterium]|nr:tetratricopeptide repeat protein [Opitutales bacterium]